MPDDLLSDRVERLEKTVEGLQALPAEVAGLRHHVASLGERMSVVEVQISQLRTDMGVEFSAVRVEFAAVRSEMQVGFANVKTELRQEIHAEIGALRGEMYEGFATARDDMLVGLANVTREIRETAEEGKRHSRMLFEEALGRIAALGEHREGSPGRKAPARRKR